MQLTNLSRGWARAVVDVPVPVSVDVNRVSDVLRRVGDEVFADADLHPLLLDPPSVMGVQSIEVDQFQVRVVARTLPGKQFDVGRALRARIAAAFLREGIHLPTALATASADGRRMTAHRPRRSTWVLMGRVPPGAGHSTSWSGPRRRARSGRQPAGAAGADRTRTTPSPTGTRETSPTPSTSRTSQEPTHDADGPDRHDHADRPRDDPADGNRALLAVDLGRVLGALTVRRRRALVVRRQQRPDPAPGRRYAAPPAEAASQDVVPQDPGPRTCTARTPYGRTLRGGEERIDRLAPRARAPPGSGKERA